MCVAGFVCVCLSACTSICSQAYVCARGAAAEGLCEYGSGSSGWRVVCVCVGGFFFLVFFLWVRVLSVCCVSAVSHGNAWLPIQAGADPAVPS